MNVTENVTEKVARALHPHAFDPHSWPPATFGQSVEEARAERLQDAMDDARRALSSLSDPEVLDGMGDVLWEHRAYPTGTPHCKCGWRPALYLNDTESDRRQHHSHQITALADWLRGQR